MQAFKTIRWLLAAAYAVMWIGGVVSSARAPSWASPFFLILTAMIVTVESKERWPLAIYAAVGFLIEVIGVHTGIPFGRYAYSGALGPAIWGVPLTICCAWLTMLAWSREAAWRATNDSWLATLLGATLMTASDLLVDPVATRILGYWHWNQNGPFFGVPLVNFAGWFGVSAVLLFLTGRPAGKSQGVMAIGVATLAFFALIAAVTGARR